MTLINLLQSNPLAALQNLFLLVLALLLVALLLDTFNLLSLKPENRQLIYTNLISVFMAMATASLGNSEIREERILNQQNSEQLRNSLKANTLERSLVFIQITDEAQRAQANQVRKALLASPNVNAPGIERVAADKATQGAAQDQALFKYFAGGNAQRANELADTIRQTLDPQFRLKVVLVPTTQPVASNQFELWFPR